VLAWVWSVDSRNNYIIWKNLTFLLVQVLKIILAKQLRKNYPGDPLSERQNVFRLLRAPTTCGLTHIRQQSKDAFVAVLRYKVWICSYWHRHLGEVRGQLDIPTVLSPRKNLGIHCKALVVLRSGLYTWGRIKTSSVCRKSNQDP
jgi:hypothetical protein